MVGSLYGQMVYLACLEVGAFSQYAGAVIAVEDSYEDACDRFVRLGMHLDDEGVFVPDSGEINDYLVNLMDAGKCYPIVFRTYDEVNLRFQDVRGRVARFEVGRGMGCWVESAEPILR